MLDFVNKAFECVDLIGHEHAAAILPTVVGQLVAARGADERNAWRHPVDLVPLMAQAFARCRGRSPQDAHGVAASPAMPSWRRRCWATIRRRSRPRC